MQLSLLGDAPVSAGPTRRQKKRMRAGWEPINHACRHCGGRLLQKEGADGVMVVRCPQCDATASGDHESLCCCGEEVAGLGRVWECFVNPAPTRANPQVVLVRERPMAREASRPAQRARKTVSVPEY